MKIKITISALLILTCLNFYGQEETVKPEYKYFVGSSLFVTFNLLLPEPPNFYQLNIGYRPNSKNAFSIEAITWSYNFPLGIPYGKSFDKPGEEYPGHIQDFGIGFVYQRFLWKGIYSSLQLLPLLHNFHDKNGTKINSGFQLFSTLRFGYHLPFLKNRFFIEPSIAFTHWPINNGVPEQFAKVESKWANYFLFEPGFHLGFKF